MDVRVEDGTWLPVLRNILWMWENLDLRWIPIGIYPFLGEDVSSGGGALVEFLNCITEDIWSCLKTIVDGETRESPDGRPLES